MGVVVYQSGQSVQESGWYEAVGSNLNHRTPVCQPVVVKLKTGALFPDWKGRAVCWRALAYSFTDSVRAVDVRAMRKQEE